MYYSDLLHIHFHYFRLFTSDDTQYERNLIHPHMKLLNEKRLLLYSFVMHQLDDLLLRHQLYFLPDSSW